MNSEHRHELEQNDLEKLIVKSRSRLKTVIETEGNRILLWASALLLLLAAFIYYTRMNQATNADGWAALDGATNAEELIGIADAYADTPVSQWARLKVGEQYLQSGTKAMFEDREAAIVDLGEAKAAFETLLNESKILPVVKERALYGMARAQETTATADLQPAIDAYNKLLQEFPGSPYEEVAKEQIEVLEKASTQEFYAWFAEQKPEPQDRELPNDLMQQFNMEELQKSLMNQQMTPPAESPTETAAPADSETNPAQPGQLTVPGAPDFPPGFGKPADMKAPEGDASKSEAPATETPAKSDPAETKPDETKPEAPATPEPAKATDKPAESDTPAKPPATDEAKPEPAPVEPEAPAAETPKAEADAAPADGN